MNTYVYGLSILVATLALGAMLRAIWKTLPMLIWTLCPTAIHSRFLTHPESDQAIAASEKLREWLRRLEAMGFSKIGIKAERPPLWGRTTLELALVHTTDNTYGSIVVDDRGRPLSLYFYTPLIKNCIVFTRNGEFAPELENDAASVRNIVSDDWGEILASHKERVSRFVQRGLTPLVGSSEQSRIEATRLFYTSQYGRKSVFQLLVFSGIPGIVSLLILILLLVAAATSWGLNLLQDAPP